MADFTSASSVAVSRESHDTAGWEALWATAASAAASRKVFAYMAPGKLSSAVEAAVT
jgi:hypothetical protein